MPATRSNLVVDCEQKGCLAPVQQQCHTANGVPWPDEKSHAVRKRSAADWWAGYDAGVPVGASSRQPELEQTARALTATEKALDAARSDLNDARAAAAFVVGYDKPTPANSGVGIIRPRPTNVLRPGIETFGKWDKNGRLNVERPIRDMVIAGFVNAGYTEVDGPLLENCEILGDPKLPAAADPFSIVHFGGTRRRQNYMHFCEVHWQGPVRKNGIGGHDFAAVRNDVHHCSDSFPPSPAKGKNDCNVDLIANCEHDRQWLLDSDRDPTPQRNAAGADVGPYGGKGWNHSDGIQVELTTFTGIRTRGNSWSALWAPDQYNGLTPPLPLATKELSCMMLKGRIESTDDWFEGGEYCVNASKTATGWIRRGKFTRDKIMHTPAGKPLAVIRNGGPLEVTDCVYDDGTPVVVAF